jgi:hypothetical protein
VAERREELRAADSDRQFVAERLRAALNEGRLTLSEYDERLEQTYAARTYGELDLLLDDLPATITGRGAMAPAQPAAVPMAEPEPAEAQPAPHRPPWAQGLWGGWASTFVVCTLIYVFTTPGGYFWPIWVIVPGVLLLVRTLGGGYGYDRYERRRLRRQERRDLRGR